MKNRICVLVIFLLATLAFAQTQQGFVKAKGRMEDGMHILGQGMKGVTVSNQNRILVMVQSDDGLLKFLSPNQTFRVESVQKKNYALETPRCSPYKKRRITPIQKQ